MGSSPTASASSTAVGRAHVILDNLIAAGKAKPMLVVMTLGYGAPEFVSRGFGVFRDVALRQRNYERYRDALFTEVMPFVENTYRVTADRESRAIAGLSMGGAESLFVGLTRWTASRRLELSAPEAYPRISMPRSRSWMRKPTGGRGRTPGWSGEGTWRR
jgi:hypothetical protein